VQHERLGEFDAPEYRVFIDSEFSEGELELGVWTLPGASRREILLLAHLCHPFMANDDLSGVAVLAAVHRRLAAKPRRYTYRFLVGPETIGSLAYLSAHEQLIPRLAQGLFLEMLGHDDAFSLQRSRQEDSPLDLALELALAARGEPFRTGGFRRVVRNDEGVVNGPGVEVPCPSLSRAAPWSEGGAPFPQYHTSADTPDILDQGRLEEAAEVVLDALEMVEADYLPVRRFRGPVFLSRYGLWVDWRSDRELNAKQDEVLHLLEGDLSLLQIARRLELDFWVLHGWLEEFRRHGLLDARPEPEPA
jgi:aminopeptidase-like protein